MYGNTFLAQNAVIPTRVSFDGSPHYKAAGVTIDWGTVASSASDTTLPDGSVIKANLKFLRYGQIICKIGIPGTAIGPNDYGPYDPNATDGRQTPTRGECFIVDQTVLQYGGGSAALSSANDHIGGVFDGGSVWIDRVLQGAGSLAGGPTLANVLTAFPSIRLVKDQ